MKFILDEYGIIRRIGDWPENADWLGESIKKWRFAESRIGAGYKIYYDGGAGTCGLCHQYPGCGGCPVRAATGNRSCLGTPYEQWVKTMTRDEPMMLEVVRAEIKFLESLRES